MITDADGRVGQAIHLQDKASKGRSGRIIPMNGELRSALQDLRKHLGPKVGQNAGDKVKIASEGQGIATVLRSRDVKTEDDE